MCPMSPPASLRLSAFILLGQLPSITAQLYNVNSYIIKTSGSCEYHVPSSAECNAAYAALINPGFTSGFTASYSCPYGVGQCGSLGLQCPRHASAVGCSVRNSASYPVYANYACTGGNAPCSANVRCLCYAPWPSPAPPIPPPSMPSHPPTPPALPAPPSPPPRNCEVCSCNVSTSGTKTSLGAYSGSYEAYEWVGGVYFISDTQEHLNDTHGKNKVDNSLVIGPLVGQIYICSATSKGGWGVSRAACCSTNAQTPLSATRASQFDPNIWGYRSYYDCSACPPSPPSPPTPPTPPPSPPTPTAPVVCGGEPGECSEAAGLKEVDELHEVRLQRIHPIARA